MEDKRIYDVRIAMAGIISLTAMEITALLIGINGLLFTVVIAAVAGIAGYNLRKK